MFELEATFPKDYLLTIQVWDYDATSSDDLIGETKVDIENRFYSRHRAHCGIAKTYDTIGYNAWRDREKPTQILEFLCQKNNLPAPDYQEDCVKIGKQKFPFTANVNGEGKRRYTSMLSSIFISTCISLLTNQFAFKSLLVFIKCFKGHNYTEKKMLMNQKHFFPKACISWIQINIP